MRTREPNKTDTANQILRTNLLLVGHAYRWHELQTHHTIKYCNRTGQNDRSVSTMCDYSACFACHHDCAFAIANVQADEGVTTEVDVSLSVDHLAYLEDVLSATLKLESIRQEMNHINAQRRFALLSSTSTFNEIDSLEMEEIFSIAERQSADVQKYLALLKQSVESAQLKLRVFEISCRCDYSSCAGIWCYCLAFAVCH